MTQTISDSKLSGLELMRLEMQRQIPDSLETLKACASDAAMIAQNIRATGRVLMLGMGASHYANRICEPFYRALEIDAISIPLSEAIYAPFPNQDRVTLLVSQSGASGEVSKYLEFFSNRERQYGLTLEAQSPLAKGLPSLVAHGGTERGFAATRSLLLTLVMHASILEALGSNDNVRAALQAPIPNVDVALETVSASRTLIYSGRTHLQGLAEVCALHTAELARVPALALEGGQFKHGPLELLEPSFGVVFLRAGGATSSLTSSLIETCLRAGITPIVFDASGEPELSNTVTIPIAHHHGLSSAIAAMLPLQNFVIGFARQRIEHVAEPRFSSKVTAE
jgi:fructoselysine-6-P-deglycase FrlB-like protein